MTTSFAGIKPQLDLPSWQATPLIYSALHVAVTGVAGATLVGDKRASIYASDNIYLLNSTTVLMQYNTVNNGWMQLPSPALAGAIAIGATAVYAPSQGPRGTFTTPLSTTSITLSTALPATVGTNQLVGQRLRIVDNASGASGTISEVTILSNTSGTTPTVTFAAIGTAPTTLGTYEFLTGRYYMLTTGVATAGMWKYWDVCTSSMSGNLSVTNLSTVGTATSIVCLDELYTPIVGAGASAAAINGEVGGYYGNITATGSSATTITGQAANNDAGVAANQWRNFQIRIVQDATTPTSVGQRRVITSHTAGASPVYTVATWTVTPSSNAKFVIENNNDILLWTNNSPTTLAYHPVANTWDTTTYAARGTAIGAGGTTFHPFGATQSTLDNQVKPSWIYSFRGGITNTLDIFDIAAASTGSWTNGATYDGQGSVTFNTSAASTYSVVDNKALLSPVSLTSTPVNMYYFDVDKNSLRPYAPCQFPPSTVTDGDRLAINIYSDGTTKKAFMYYLGSTTNTMMRSLFIPQA